MAVEDTIVSPIAAHVLGRGVNAGSVYPQARPLPVIRILVSVLETLPL